MTATFQISTRQRWTQVTEVNKPVDDGVGGELVRVVGELGVFRDFLSFKVCLVPVTWEMKTRYSRDSSRNMLLCDFDSI